MNEPKNTVTSVKSPVTEKTITDAKVEDKSVANIKTEEKSEKKITKYTVKPGDTLEKNIQIILQQQGRNRTHNEYKFH